MRRIRNREFWFNADKKSLERNEMRGVCVLRAKLAHLVTRTLITLAR